MKRIALLVSMVATLVAVPAALADPLLTVPLCDLEGHCDKSCSVYASPKQPVVCR